MHSTGSGVEKARKGMNQMDERMIRKRKEAAEDPKIRDEVRILLTNMGWPRISHKHMTDLVELYLEGLRKGKQDTMAAVGQAIQPAPKKGSHDWYWENKIQTSQDEYTRDQLIFIMEKRGYDRERILRMDQLLPHGLDLICSHLEQLSYILQGPGEAMDRLEIRWGIHKQTECRHGREGPCSFCIVDGPDGDHS